MRKFTTTLILILLACAVVSAQQQKPAAAPTPVPAATPAATPAPAPIPLTPEQAAQIEQLQKAYASVGTDKAEVEDLKQQVVQLRKALIETRYELLLWQMRQKAECWDCTISQDGKSLIRPESKPEVKK